MDSFSWNSRDPRDVALATHRVCNVRVTRMPQVAEGDLIPIQIEVDGIPICEEAVEPETLEAIESSAAFKEPRRILFIARRVDGGIVGEMGVELRPGDDPCDELTKLEEEEVIADAEENDEFNVLVFARTFEPENVLETGIPLQRIALRMFAEAMCGKVSDPEKEALRDLLEGL